MLSISVDEVATGERRSLVISMVSCQKGPFGRIPSIFLYPFQANPATNMQQHEYLKSASGDKDKSFQRKGAIGDWKNTLSEEQNKYLDDLTEKTFKGSGLEFQFEWNGLIIDIHVIRLWFRSVLRSCKILFYKRACGWSEWVSEGGREWGREGGREGVSENEEEEKDCLIDWQGLQIHNQKINIVSIFLLWHINIRRCNLQIQ